MTVGRRLGLVLFGVWWEAITVPLAAWPHVTPEDSRLRDLWVIMVMDLRMLAIGLGCSD